MGHKVVEGCARLPFDPILLGGCYLATMLFLKNQTSGISFQRESQESTTTQKWSKIMTKRESLPPSFQGSWVLGNRPPITPLQIRVVAAAVLPGGPESEGQSFQVPSFHHHSIHGTGIFTYIELKFMVNAGKYKPYMDAYLHKTLPNMIKASLFIDES